MTLIEELKELMGSSKGYKNEHVPEIPDELGTLIHENFLIAQKWRLVYLLPEKEIKQKILSAYCPTKTNFEEAVGGTFLEWKEFHLEFIEFSEEMLGYYLAEYYKQKRANDK